MRTNVYVDGFNLYYGSLVDTPYRWLDLSALCRHLLARHQIHRIRYFTALVTARPGDPTKTDRQLTYLRALRTIPNLSIHFGQYRERNVRLPLVRPPRLDTRFVEVIRTDEKGSDVNLATYLLADGFDSDYEVAVVVSNDSDLLAPIKMIRERLRFGVGILSPTTNPGRRVSKDLAAEATFFKKIRRSALQKCQFPDTLRDKHGTITKPSAW